MKDAKCSIDYKTGLATGNKQVDFLVAENTLKNTYSIKDPHYKMLISFYLLKIDKWDPRDEIHLYLNDLLVLRKSYSSFGNRICYNSTENDLVSYE